MMDYDSKTGSTNQIDMLNAGPPISSDPCARILLPSQSIGQKYMQGAGTRVQGCKGPYIRTERKKRKRSFGPRTSCTRSLMEIIFFSSDSYLPVKTILIRRYHTRSAFSPHDNTKAKNRDSLNHGLKKYKVCF